MSEREQADSSAQQSSKLFDLRTIIGFLFLVYGIVCLIWGLVSFTQVDHQKAGGINVNLWSGIGMIILGGAFVIWSFSRPLQVEEPSPDTPESDDGPDGTGSAASNETR